MWASQVLLDRFIPWLRNPAGAGSSFEVHIVESDVLQRGVRATLPTNLRENIALKRPIMTGNPTSDVDQHIWASLITEFRILTNPLLGHHPNIVKLLGNVWQSVGTTQTTIAPVLVLEAASGNLKELYSPSGPGIKVREAIELFSDIAFGLDALHNCGVIHGDLKPENILIFRDHDGSCTAKLADFGSSIVLRDMQSSVRLSGGTLYWRAPEYNNILLMSDLIAIEIYSFGLLMLDFFIPGAVQEAQKRLRDIAARNSTPGSAHELLQNLAYELVCDTYDLEQLAQLIHQCLMVPPSMRPQTMEDVIERLQDLLGAAEVEQEDLDKNAPESIAGSETPQATESDSLEVLASRLLAADINSLPMITHNHATMRILPRAVSDQVIDELERIALEDVDAHRQSVAAFQLSFALICGLSTRPQPVAGLALNMLLHSAKTGYEQAQAMVGWMYDAFDQQFPIPQDVEEEWLYRAINKGFPTARHRLRKLNSARHEEALSELRHANGGIGENFFQGRWPDAEELDFAYIPLWETGAMRVQPRLLHYLAATGLSEALQLVLDRLELDINEPGPQSATPLSLACRSGHLGVGKMLLSRGADPTITDEQGATPLHWLSSFHADELGEVTRLLLKHGANIEARARQTRMYIREDDITSHLGRHGGTPLLWAVADANLPAVQVLLNAGADPWDKAGKELLGSNNWGETTHLSPIHLAARGHMYEILSLLLRDSHDPEALNADYRTLGSDELAFAMLPLGWAVCYGGSGSFEAILWHGREYEVACERTIQLLLDRGANPKQVTSCGHHAVELATQWGQAFMIEFLGRALRGDQVPTDDNIRICLSNALLQENAVIFDALMSGYFEASKDLRNDLALLDRAASNTDNPHFMASLLEHFIEITQPLGTTVFETAVRRGNYSVARLLHDHGLFDPTCTERFIFSNSTIKKDSPTVLGAFILNSTFSNLSARAVRFILSLLEDEDPDSLQPQPAFWARPSELQRMSALHLAVLVPELRGDLTGGAEVINDLLVKFHEPCHLNSIAMPTLRFTPLHLAVYLANLSAIDVLLNEEDVDPSLTDEQGRTPMDLALFRVFEATDEVTMDHILAWCRKALPRTTRESVAEMRKNNSVEVLSQLMRKRLRTEKYASVIIKESELSVSVITPNNEPPTDANDKDSRINQIRMPTDEAQIAQMRQSPFLRKLVDMPVGGVALLRAFESEVAATAAGHSTEDLHRIDGAMASLQIREPTQEARGAG